MSRTNGKLATVKIRDFHILFNSVNKAQNVTVRDRDGGGQVVFEGRVEAGAHEDLSKLANDKRMKVKFGNIRGTLKVTHHTFIEEPLPVSEAGA